MFGGHFEKLLPLATNNSISCLCLWAQMEFPYFSIGIDCYQWQQVSSYQICVISLVTTTLD